MSPIVLGTAAGAAALTVGQSAVTAVGKGLSFAAQLVLPASASSGQPSETAETNAATADLKQRTDELAQRIERQLTAAGIQLSQPIELASDNQGGIAVVTDHPQAAAIQAALSTDILLERDFTMLAGDYEEFVQQGRAGDLPPTMTILVPKAS